MTRRTSLPRTNPSLPSLLFQQENLLPRPQSRRPKFRLRQLLGRSKYRGFLLWAGAAFILLFLAFGSRSNFRSERLLELAKFDRNGKARSKSGSDFKGSGAIGHGGTSNEAVSSNGKGSDDKANNAKENDDNSESVYVVMVGKERVEIPLWRLGAPHWLRFRHLDGFYLGLKALVPASEYRPEHPRLPGEESPYPLTLFQKGLPTPALFVPQPDYESAEYTAHYHKVAPCYLDKAKTVPVPDIFAYNGIVQGQSESIMGSHSLLGLRDDICFDRFGRYGPYGLGYTFAEGGMQVGVDTERAGSEVVWATTGKINYTAINWGEAQTQCYEANKMRFAGPDEQNQPSETATASATLSGRWSQDQKPPKEKISRTAVVVRAYTGFQWTHHAVLNMRAMISELALRSGGEYTVHFLVHVRDDDEAIFADPLTAQRVLIDAIPREFHNISTLWSEDQMRLIYPPYEYGFSNPSGKDVHGVYRSAHMALQHFAMKHPEYEHFWNWELDVRWVGNYYELFDRLGKWAKQQSRIEAWERSARYYIPHHHGSWANFTAAVHNKIKASKQPPVLGPVSFPGRLLLRAELGNNNTFLPPSCITTTITAAGVVNTTPDENPACGVGEEADLITLNPIFDAKDSGWIFSNDVSGYSPNHPLPPRRSSIITASRLSRRLLAAMHEENWRLQHNMFSEMFPATAALHHGLKAVFAPHPVWVDREWDVAAAATAFNSGRDGSAGGKGSPYDLRNEHNHKGTSWYYHSEFAGLLWRRWLGYAERDGRGKYGGRAGEGALRGGKAEEESAEGTGRMCLRSMLVHPVKWEHPSELEGYRRRA